jgi:DNA anti-recombination protein RmuC
MTPTDIALLGGLCLSIINQLVMPRMREQRKAAKARAAGTEVSWQSMNARLVQERDRSDKALQDQAEAHRAEIAELKEQHSAEINQMRDRWERDATEMRRALDAEASEMKRRYDEEMSTLSTRLSECQTKVNELYRELYELQRLLPPDVPWPPR